MAYLVEITEPALADAEEYVRFIRDVNQEPEAAEKWFRGLVSKIHSLEERPERCPIIPEQDEFSIEIRHVVHLSHRIIFRVWNERRLVTVYRIYHGARKRLAKQDLASREE